MLLSGNKRILKSIIQTFTLRTEKRNHINPRDVEGAKTMKRRNQHSKKINKNQRK